MSNEEILLNKVLDASSNTIWDELKKIRESSEATKKVIRRRWIWELIQNASDCTPKNEKIDIGINYANNKVVFSHNGLPFSYGNLLDLITQISSKQSSEEKKIGKFGTGFMSTHLLSEIVQIEGSFVKKEHNYTKLEFTVDRTGNEYSDIKTNTKIMLEQLEILNNSQSEFKDYYDDTKFIYSIEDEVEIREAVEQGIRDLIETIPYVLAFNKSINSITYNGDVYRKVKELTSSINDKVKLIQIEGPNGNRELIILNDNSVTIACAIERIDSEIYFLPILSSIPKVFCEFPLVGTEEFSFPIIVNSTLFEVERDRNAIRDNNETNMELIRKAVALYKELISFCLEHKSTRNEFNICILNKPYESNIQEYCYAEIKKYIEKKPIIPAYDDLGGSNRIAFKNSSDQIVIGIPLTIDEENRDLFWDILSNFKGVTIPTKNTYQGWAKVFGTNVSFSWINDTFLKDSNMEKLNSYLTNENILEWLNMFYNLWIKDAGIDKVVTVVFVPNQNNEFVKFDRINLDNNIDGELKNILFLLEENILSTLLIKEITAFGGYFHENPKRVKTSEKCSERIDEKISQILSKETIDRVEREEHIQNIFNKLTNWFILNQEKAKEWFGNLYSKRMMLSTPEENLRRYKIAEKIEENNIKYEELDEIISNRDKVLEIISNSELSREDIIEQLKHVVTSSEELKRYVEGLIKRSIQNIYQYLSTISDYILPPTIEEWMKVRYSETIFPAKYKGTDIRIVIRPSDYQKIIFYYEEELEALDDINYQLWTDDGKMQRMITLGDLLKTTGISRIPLTKL